MNFTEFYAHRRFSKIPSRTPDLAAYPLYNTAQKIELVLEKGDALFIPAGWFHFVFSTLTDPVNRLNIATNFFVKHEGCVDCMDKATPLAPQIQEVDCVSPDRFANHVAQNTPLLHKHFDVQHPWPCYHWTRSRLSELLGTKTLQVNVSDDGMFVSNWVEYFDKEHTKEQHMSFSHFLANTNKEHLYMIQQTNDAFAKDIGKPIFLQRDQGHQPAMWINHGKVSSSLHYDTHDNLLVQVSGVKEVVLFPPSEGDKLYLYNPYPTSWLCRLRSQVGQKTGCHTQLNNADQFYTTCLSVLSRNGVAQNKVYHVEHSIKVTKGQAYTDRLNFGLSGTFVTKDCLLDLCNVLNVPVHPTFQFLDTCRVVLRTEHPYVMFGWDSGNIELYCEFMGYIRSYDYGKKTEHTYRLCDGPALVDLSKVPHLVWLQNCLNHNIEHVFEKCTFASRCANAHSKAMQKVSSLYIIKKPFVLPDVGRDNMLALVGNKNSAATFFDKRKSLAVHALAFGSDFVSLYFR